VSYRGPIVDVDVHHAPGLVDDWLDYMSGDWADLIRSSCIPVRPATKHYPSPFGFMRLETFGENGAVVPGSDLTLMRTQLLDPLKVERAILSHTSGPEIAQDNPYFGVALATAMNDWSIDRWLSTDDSRLYGALIVYSRFPEAAADEIRRVGHHPKLVEVVIIEGGLGPPLGHPIYHPIYDAAAEYELPIAIHVGATIGNGSAQLSAGGPACSVIEWYTHLNQPVMHHLTSFITHGVFEKWPRLQLLLLEGGFAWVPWISARLDSEYAQFRRETPWLKRLPSEYIREHARFSTQPFEVPTGQTTRFRELLGTFDGMDDVLLFSTDYPHWDADGPAMVTKYLPPDWHEKVFYGNAMRLLRWPSRDSAEAVRAA
jgi:uncharacterized protein